MFDIVHRVGIKAPTTQVFTALNTLEGLSQWWTEEVQGSPRVGGQIEFTFRTPEGKVKGKMVMEVEEDRTPEYLLWCCVDGPAEWIGTRISYQLSEQDGQTIVLFAHRGWEEAVEFTAHCSTKWATFLLSLKSLLETGKGRPSPDDLKIDNWN